MPEQIKRIFVFDFEGTLSEIVPEKGTAELHVENRRLLQELAEMTSPLTPGSRVVSEPGLPAGEVRKILAKLPDTTESRL